MKIKVPHLVAAPFFGLSGYLGFGLFQSVAATAEESWITTGPTVILGVLGVVVTLTPGILALRRCWHDFVKVVATAVLLALFVFVSVEANHLAESVELIADPEQPFLYALWTLGVIVAPLLLCLAAYEQLVPPLIRCLQRALPAER